MVERFVGVGDLGPVGIAEVGSPFDTEEVDSEDSRRDPTSLLIQR